MQGGLHFSLKIKASRAAAPAPRECPTMMISYPASWRPCMPILSSPVVIAATDRLTWHTVPLLLVEDVQPPHN